MPEPMHVSRVPVGSMQGLAALLAFADKMACELQDQRGASPHLWLLRCGPVIDIFAADWKDDAEKYATFDALRATLSHFPEITAYASISEVWVAAYARGERRPTAHVRNDPRRKSMLLITAFERGGRHMVSAYEVTHGTAGKPARTPVKLGVLQMGGAGSNLFEEEAPVPPGFNPVADA